jgi:DNA-binding NarL/FixJ family response regulator
MPAVAQSEPSGRLNVKPTPGEIRVAIVEDDVNFNRAIADSIERAANMVLVGRATSLAAGMDLLELEAPDVLVVDLGLPDGSGIELIQAARFIWRRCEIMVSTIFGDEAHVIAAIEAGATGYLLKDTPQVKLVEEIRSLHAGGSPISPVIARKLLSKFNAAPRGAVDPAAVEKPPGGALSKREQTVLELITRGYSHAEVALKLGVSQQTVLTFVRRIYLKFGVRTRAEAIYAARRYGVGA